MDVEDLSLIGPSVDLTHVDGINQKRLVAFINHFIINTASFLNKFAKSCDSKLFQLHLKLQNVEASLVLLENKLESIPSLTVPKSNEPNVNVEPKTVPVPDPVSVPVVEETIKEEKGEKEEKKTLSEGLLRYYKMLAVGVPEPAVRMKMAQEGVSDEDQKLVLEYHA